MDDERLAQVTSDMLRGQLRAHGWKRMWNTVVASGDVLEVWRRPGAMFHEVGSQAAVPLDVPEQSRAGFVTLCVEQLVRHDMAGFHDRCEAVLDTMLREGASAGVA